MGRWVKLLGAIVALAILLVVAIQLMGGGEEHGPQRHGQAVAPER